MAFGSSITGLTKQAEGEYGYIVKINTANLLAQIIESVQAQSAADDTPEPVSGQTSVSSLYGYLNSSVAPDLAYNYSDGECQVFLLTSVFPYDALTRFALYGKRKAQNCTEDSDLLDCPDRDLNLLLAYSLRIAYGLKKGGTPKWISDKIKIGEREIRG